MTRRQRIDVNLALIFCAIALACIVIVWACGAGARDATGLSAQLSPAQQDWVRGLHNAAGEWCCDDADGLDPQWQMDRSGYRVFLEGDWRKVDPAVVLTVPNKIGIARVWVGHLSGVPVVRCFLPGPAT